MFLIRGFIAWVPAGSENWISIMEKNALELFLFLFILCFFFGALFLFRMVDRSRLGKIKVASDTLYLRPLFDELLIRYLFEEISLEELLGDAEVEKALKQGHRRTLLLSELLKLHENFSGAFAARLEKFYRESELVLDSEAKLLNGRWDIQCKGMRELTQMKEAGYYREMLNFSQSRNETLRQEARNSIVKLQGFSGLIFLKDFSGQMSAWEQLSLISILRSSNSVELPDFSVWLKSDNPSVREFSLRLIVEFNQAPHPDILWETFSRGNQTIRILCLQALEGRNAGVPGFNWLQIFKEGHPSLKEEILLFFEKHPVPLPDGFFESIFQTGMERLWFPAFRLMVSLQDGEKRLMAVSGLTPDIKREFVEILNLSNWHD